ncbi:hypothetical protein [Agaribacterium sp. ZY112]|uniref:hypothetical protein n=1 Tax=Agaribacterium sp. ZY112 TaxID=3233574 RepID=UPI0035240066
MNRKTFLKYFLGSLGARDIRWDKITDESISGTVLYELDDPEEVQDFIWHETESNTPPKAVYDLTRTIYKSKLLDIDKLTVTRDELYRYYCKEISRISQRKDFNYALESLLSIEIPMVDDGIETDIYFIHE